MLVTYFLLAAVSLVSADEPVFSECREAGVTITSAKGHITSPNYPNKYPASQDCKWILKPPIGVSLRLRVDHLNNKEVFDQGSKCYDTLRISTGRDDEQFTYIDKGGLCAVTSSDLSQDTYEIQDSGNKSTLTKIEFVSDYSDHLTGFSISFEALCNKNLFGESGSFKSPGFPRSYPNNAECYFTIKTPVGTHVEIKFTSFRLEKLACETDYVIIAIGAADDINESQEKYCGYISPGTLRFAFNKVTILFVTGPANTEQGFEVEWKAVSANSPTTTVLPATTMPAAKNCSTTNTSKTCQRWDETFPHKPKYTPQDDMNHNYCRNPDNDPQGYWCYTTDPDTRWEYCDLQNCIVDDATTTASSLTTDKSTTVNKTTASKTTMGKTTGSNTEPEIVLNITGRGREMPDVLSDNGTISTAQQVSPDDSGFPWFLYLIVGICALMILLAIIFFIWRRKHTKRQILINDETLENSVQFNQTHRGLDDHKENTYVEIPYNGRPPRPKPRRNRDAECSEFPGKQMNDPSNTAGTSQSSVGSLNYSDGRLGSTSGSCDAGMQGQSSCARDDPYSVANDEGPRSTITAELNKGLYNMAEDVNEAQAEENLYQTIGLGDQEVIPPADKVEAPVATVRNGVKKSKSKQENGKKARKKPFLRIFANQRETDTEKNSPRDNLSQNNPFDTDDEEQQVTNRQDKTESSSMNTCADISSTQYDMSDTLVMENKASTQEFTDPIIVDPVTHSLLPDDAPMVCISPAIIDNNSEEEDSNIFINNVIYSVPKPTSPEFSLEGFIYDIPVNNSRSNSESTKSDTNHSPSIIGSERDNSSTSESENSNLTPVHDPNQSSNSQGIYCTMNSVPLLQKKHKKTQAKKQTRSPPKSNSKDEQKNIRHSLLYTSMKGNSTEKHKSELGGKKVYENIAKPRQSL